MKPGECPPGCRQGWQLTTRALAPRLPGPHPRRQPSGADALASSPPLRLRLCRSEDNGGRMPQNHHVLQIERLFEDAEGRKAEGLWFSRIYDTAMRWVPRPPGRPMWQCRQ
jgi:hypothetical protein